MARTLLDSQVEILAGIAAATSERERLDKAITSAVLKAAALGVSNAEIGRRLGVTGEAVRQIVAKHTPKKASNSAFSLAKDRKTFSVGRPITSADVASLWDSE